MHEQFKWFIQTLDITERVGGLDTSIFASTEEEGGNLFLSIYLIEDYHNDDCHFFFS